MLADFLYVCSPDCEVIDGVNDVVFSILLVLEESLTGRRLSVCLSRKIIKEIPFGAWNWWQRHIGAMAGKAPKSSGKQNKVRLGMTKPWPELLCFLSRQWWRIASGLSGRRYARDTRWLWSGEERETNQSWNWQPISFKRCWPSKRWSRPFLLEEEHVQRLEVYWFTVQQEDWSCQIYCRTFRSDRGNLIYKSSLKQNTGSLNPTKPTFLWL